MSHFAKVENGIVTQVIVIEQEVLNTGYWGDPSSWVQTSYNTYAGQHTLGGTPLRKNYAGIGYTYDKERDAFYAPKPFVSWVLNEDTCIWEAPVPMPTDGAEKGVFYTWNESHLTWDSTPIPTE
jgi:hypothetical protein